MRPIIDMETVQIEITNACVHNCSNCTRLVGHHAKPFFMDYETFKRSVDAMEEFPPLRVIGMMGGEPLLHPDFKKFCGYMHKKLPPGRCGLWTSFPKGKEHHREVIAETFGHIFLNDHTRDDILHGPILVASEELEMHPWFKDYLINKCWVQNAWSASMTPDGAFFCEVAAALSALLDKPGESLGWPIERGWWKRSPKEYVAQMERYCKKCGAAMPLKRRPSVDGRDDVSPGMLKALRGISPKIKSGKFVEHAVDDFCEEKREEAKYKEQEFRDGIAARYGMFLAPNGLGYCTPKLKKNYKPEEKKSRELSPV